MRIRIGAFMFAGASCRADRVVRPYGCVRLYIGAYWFAALYCAGGVESLPFVLLLKARERDICCTADVFVVSRHDQNAVGCAAHCHKNALQNLATLRKRR